MPKFNPSLAKLLAVEDFFTSHRPITAHSIKDLEKAIPAATGISGMQVKDYLTALVDENKIRVEKIGSGNWYWCFKGDEKKQKETEVKILQKDVRELEVKAAELHEEVERERRVKEGTSSKQGVAVAGEIQRLKLEKAELELEIASYADNDPIQIDHIRELILLMKMAGNTHTDNIYNMEAYLKGLGMATEDLTRLKRSLGIPEELEDIE
ncbi:hypothetical protein ABW19_dt0203581 [Dactylella cylindrospora]|nr:hypothetical protein ABW19_dt0203581 [Dactylella cylindrospora]